MKSMQVSMVKCYDPHRELLLAIVNCDKSRTLRSLPIDPHMYWHTLPIKSLKRVSRIRNASTNAGVKLNPNPHHLETGTVMTGQVGADHAQSSR